MNCQNSGLWTRHYVSILGSTFLAYVGFQMLVPTLTTYIKQIGGTDLSAGLAYSMAAAAALLARALFGNRLDRIGRRPILIFGLILIAGVNVLLFFISNIPVICALRFVQGIGWGAVSTALATVTADVTPIKRMGEGIGYLALSIALATSLSIILGIWVMNGSGFIATLGCSTLSFIVCFLLYQRTSTVPFRRFEGERHTGQSVWSTLFEKKAVAPAFLCFLHSLAFSGIMAFIMLFGMESGITNIWVFFIGHLLMVVVSRPIVGRLFDRKGPAAVIPPGVLFMIAGLVLLSYSHGLATLVLASMCYGLGFGTVQPSLQAWAIRRSPADRKGAANGTFLSSLDLGYALGTVLMGGVASLTSYAFMYRASSLLLIVFLVLYGFILASERGARTPRRPAP